MLVLVCVGILEIEVYQEWVGKLNTKELINVPNKLPNIAPMLYIILSPIVPKATFLMLNDQIKLIAKATNAMPIFNRHKKHLQKTRE